MTFSLKAYSAWQCYESAMSTAACFCLLLFDLIAYLCRRYRPNGWDPSVRTAVDLGSEQQPQASREHRAGRLSLASGSSGVQLLFSLSQLFGFLGFSGDVHSTQLKDKLLAGDLRAAQVRGAAILRILYYKDVQKAEIRSYFWLGLSLTFIYSGFDCGSLHPGNTPGYSPHSVAYPDKKKKNGDFAPFWVNTQWV